MNQSSGRPQHCWAGTDDGDLSPIDIVYRTHIPTPLYLLWVLGLPRAVKLAALGLLPALLSPGRHAVAVAAASRGETMEKPERETSGLKSSRE